MIFSFPQSIQFVVFVFIVNTENSSLASIQGQISSNGMSIPHKIERTKELHTWHLKFRPYTSGSYKIHLTSNGLSLLSKNLFFCSDINSNYLEFNHP